MADWTNAPDLKGQRIVRHGPPTLKTSFDDGTVLAREKHSAVKREFIYDYTLSAAAAKTALDLLETKGLATTFTIITHDPSTTTPATDETAVRNMELPETEWVGPVGPVLLRCRFMEA